MNINGKKDVTGRYKGGIKWLNYPQRTGYTWNPITGCSMESPGCLNCYAEKLSRRRGLHWGSPIFHPERIDQPKKVKSPGLIFCGSMADVFHDKIEVRWVDDIVRIIHECPQHFFIFLTKRDKNMRHYINSHVMYIPTNAAFGVSIESNEQKERAEHLSSSKTINKIISFEPLIGPVDNVPLGGIGWVIAGGENGPGARPCNPEWVLEIKDRCKDLEIPFFFKGWGSNNKYGLATQNCIYDQPQMEFPKFLEVKNG